LDRIGLANKVFQAAVKIDVGRKGFAARGKEQEGRISYEDGISEALAAFTEVQVGADPQTLILAEIPSSPRNFNSAAKPTKIP
jgi:hypothetical protein